MCILLYVRIHIYKYMCKYKYINIVNLNINQYNHHNDLFKGVTYTYASPTNTIGHAN